MSVISQPAGEPAAAFQFGEFTYDSASRLLMRGETRLHLSPKAQQLLLMLLQARPRAVSREELYDALWPSTFVCETNLAGVVNEIRSALGDGARASLYIRTVHGFGYAFKDERSVASAYAAATLVCGKKSYPLHEGENLVGRAPDARVLLADGSISRRHAVITIHGRDSAWIRDLESKNGTYVDGRKIGSTAVSLSNRTMIGLGAAVASIRFRNPSTTDSLRLDTPELRRQVAERMANAVS